MSQINQSWPGERFPTRLDVEDAYTVPEPSFFRNFKQALLARNIAHDYQHVSSQASSAQHSQLPLNISGWSNGRYSSQQFTYPLSLLADFPKTPNVERLKPLESTFWTLSKQMLFFRGLSMPSALRSFPPPYLQLSSACLASCLSSSPEVAAALSEQRYANKVEASKSLFFAGFRVWGIMLEVDNREARKFEAVLASALLATYGTLSADARLWNEVTELLGYTGPLVRRLHMHDYGAEADGTSWRTRNNAIMRNHCSLMSYLFGVDVVRTLHHNASPQFRTAELFILMPASNHDFHDIYTNMVDKGLALPIDMAEAEDAILLLSALLSDIVLVHRLSSKFDLRPIELPTLQNPTSEAPLTLLSPFVPFSPLVENQRMLVQLSKGLDIWSERFADDVSDDILALFYFCKLCLAYPEILSLPLLARYRPTLAAHDAGSASLNDHATVPGQTMKFVWLIVDHINMETLQEGVTCPFWLPVITYLTALVVWTHLRSSSSSQSGYGTLKVLGLFKAELRQMLWPCCTEMIQNLDDLMRSTS